MHIDTTSEDFRRSSTAAKAVLSLDQEPPAIPAQEPVPHPAGPKEPFYKKLWFAVLWAIILPPLGIALLAGYAKKHSLGRGILAALASFWLCVIAVTATAYFGFLAPNHLVQTTPVISGASSVSNDSTSLVMEIASVEFGPDDNLRVLGDMSYAGGYRWNGIITLEMLDADGNRVDGIAASNLKVSCYSDKTKCVTLPKAATSADIDDIASFRITTSDGEVLITSEDSSALVKKAVDDYRYAHPKLS